MMSEAAMYPPTDLYNVIEQSLHGDIIQTVVKRMPKSGYIIKMIALCMVILTCITVGCVNFSPMIPGSGQGGPGSGGSGPGGSPAMGPGPGNGGGSSPSGPGGGGLGGGGSGGGLPPTGGEIPRSDLKTTPMYTYFTVTCHFHDQFATDDRVDSITDGTMTGEIPIEMIREYNDLGMDIWTSGGAKMNLRYTYQEFCPPDDQFCKPCKTTYEGPAYGSAAIERAPSGGTTTWMAMITLLGPSDYDDWCSGFDPKGNFCPPRYPSYSQTGEPRTAIPPVQDTCSGDAPQDVLYRGISAVSCDITDAPFVLRDGEVITNSWKNEITEHSYESADATYTFHISAR